jgi:hypothetical protein
MSRCADGYIAAMVWRGNADLCTGRVEFTVRIDPNVARWRARGR